MAPRPRVSLVRGRLVAVIPGLVLFTLLGHEFTADVLRQPWFYIGLGMALSATFVEPFFAKPQDAIVNAAGGIGAFVSVERAPIESLWWVYFGFLVVVMGAGVIAAATGDGAAVHWAAFRVSSRFGRAIVIGTSALLLVVLTEAARQSDHFEYLALATGVLVVATAVDWARLLKRAAGRLETATAIAAIGPRMLLVAGATHDLAVGDLVDLGPSQNSTAASVVARMPHADGLRYQLVLESEWTAVCSDFPADLELSLRGSDSALVGAVGEGTTERRIEFEPFRPLTIGAPLRLDVGSRVLLYQVTRLELVAIGWAGARAVVGRAQARLVGWPEPTGLRGGAYLPPAHELIHRAQAIAGSLPSGYHEVGRIKDTNIAIGLRVDDSRRGHVAILGMSGMGKTAVAHRLSLAFGATSPVIALDTTGEYGRRLGFPSWTAGDFATVGHFVYEPAGDPPRRAAEFITQCMTAGHGEYQGGKQPHSRVVVLEEAHGFVPESNFAQRIQLDHVSNSARMIMQARKFGVTFVLVSQRTAVVTKSALSQCENYIILKTIDQTSLDYLETLVGAELRDALPKLERYEALCVGPAFNTDEPVIVSLSPP